MEQLIAFLLLVLVVLIIYFLTVHSQKQINWENFNVIRLGKPLLIKDDVTPLVKIDIVPTSEKDDFDKDSFINFRGTKVRRNLVPSNYTEHNDHANFHDSSMHFLVNQDKPRELITAPVAYNFYFAN